MQLKKNKTKKADLPRVSLGRGPFPPRRFAAPPRDLTNRDGAGRAGPCRRLLPRGKGRGARGDPRGLPRPFPGGYAAARGAWVQIPLQLAGHHRGCVLRQQRRHSCGVVAGGGGGGGVGSGGRVRGGRVGGRRSGVHRRDVRSANDAVVISLVLCDAAAVAVTGVGFGHETAFLFVFALSLNFRAGFFDDGGIVINGPGIPKGLAAQEGLDGGEAAELRGRLAWKGRPRGVDL